DGDKGNDGAGKQDNEDGPDEGGIDALVEVSDELTSQSRHSLRLSGSPPHGKLLIPPETAPTRTERASGTPGRDVRVVEGARLEIALTVCDGLLQISITVADSES
ncbi:MAG TPA: hypothetical protein VNI78_03230, partial [Vicinamibacterales bacterium]|nr:hypothetical protein [Vicinamibacterales bacterium]